jgi:hypothetical protein
MNLFVPYSRGVVALCAESRSSIQKPGYQADHRYALQGNSVKHICSH